MQIHRDIATSLYTFERRKNPSYCTALPVSDPQAPVPPTPAQYAPATSTLSDFFSLYLRPCSSFSRTAPVASVISAAPVGLSLPSVVMGTTIADPTYQIAVPSAILSTVTVLVVDV